MEGIDSKWLQVGCLGGGRAGGCRWGVLQWGQEPHVGVQWCVCCAASVVP